MSPRLFAGLRAWGPYRSEYRLLKKMDEDGYPSTPLVLIATGAGCAFVLDFYWYVTANAIALDEAVTIYFSTRSIRLFQMVTDATCTKKVHNLFVNAHLTSHENIVPRNKDRDRDSGKAKDKSRESAIGRLDMDEILVAAEK